MTSERAEQVANVIVTAAAVGAAYYVLRTPKLRQVAWGIVRANLKGRLPVWLKQEVQHAWRETGRSRL